MGGACKEHIPRMFTIVGFRPGLNKKSGAGTSGAEGPQAKTVLMFCTCGAGPLKSMSAGKTCFPAQTWGNMTRMGRGKGVARYDLDQVKQPRRCGAIYFKKDCVLSE
jgi:hypothetical protein